MTIIEVETLYCFSLQNYTYFSTTVNWCCDDGGGAGGGDGCNGGGFGCDAGGGVGGVLIDAGRDRGGVVWCSVAVRCKKPDVK